MASTPTLRPGEPSADPEGPAVLREAAPVRGAALAAVGAAAFLLVALLLGDGERGQPAFLRAALGPEASESALERSPAPGVAVSIDDDGYTVARRGFSVSVAAEDTSGEEWELYAHGASRLTDFGTETIVVDGSTTESFLTVTKRQGPRTWRWRLETRLVPRLARDGGVSFLDPTRHRDTALAIEPAAILDADGDDVTPEGLRWGLVLDGGEWWLALDLDDSDLPLPYVIDPAVEYPSPLYLSNEVSAVTGSWRLVTAAPGTLDMTTGTETCRNCPGYWQWIPGAANAAEGTPSTTPTGEGWIVDTAGATGFPAGDWNFTVQTDIPSSFTAGAAVLTVVVWKGTVSGGAFTATQTLLPPTDGTTNLRPHENPVTTRETFPLPKFSLAADERLYVEYWRHQTGGINAPQAPRRRLDFYVNDGVARIEHPPADDAAPSHAVSVVELTNPGGQHFDAATSTHYYSTAAGGTFRVDDAAADTGSSVFEVRFPAVALTGFTHTAASDGTSPYRSNTYAWTAANTISPGTQAIVAEDNALNTSSPSPQLTITRDMTGPAAFSLAAPSPGTSIRDGQFVSAAPADAGAGVASVEFRYCPGATCSFSTGTSIGTDASAPYSVTWTGQPADGAYTLLARATDNVGNTTDSAPRAVTVDNGDPSAVFSFPAAGSAYNDTGWNAGCGSSGFCGTASDANSSVTGVVISIERESDGLFWDGGAFGAVSDTFLAASLAGSSWSYAFPASGFPADGDYTVHVRATDAAGNAEAGPSRTFTIDTVEPQTTVDAGPTDPTNATGADFDVSADEPGSAFECRLDGGAFSPCTSPRSYTGLSDGSHTFRVRATDAAGNTDPTPASLTWTIDTAAPETAIDSSPTDPTSATGADFGFSADEPGSTFECELDGGGFSSCASPESYPSLADGPHTFRVRATDAVGNTDATPAAFTWTVDTAAAETAIDSAPADPTSASNADFEFSADEPGSAFECELDGGGYATCASPESYAGLADGSHTFIVRATDGAGNTDPSPASYTWEIDTAAPETSIDSDPADPTNATGADFGFSADEPGSTFECRLDGGAFSPCASPESYAGLSDGGHTFEVRATDAAGNTDPTPAQSAWTVDTVGPTGSVTAPADGSFLRGTVSVSSDSADALAGVESVLFERRPAVGGAWTAIATDETPPYAADWDTSALADGDYELRALTTDAAGNTFASGSRAATVDNTPPGSAVLDPLPAAIRNGQTLAGSGADAGSGVDVVDFRYCAGAGCTFAPGALVGTDASAPYGVTWTGQPADGDYEVIARVTDRAGNTLDSARRSITIDNTDPTGSLTAPAGGALVSDTVTVSSDSGDGGSGVDSVVFERRPAGGGAWTAIATDETPPYAVDWDTSALADGDYELRAVTTDEAGNAAVSATRTVGADNNAPTVSLTAPSGYVNASAEDPLTVSATTPDSDLTGVELFRCSDGSAACSAGSWVSLGTDASAPYEASWAIDGDGNRALRAVATDRASNTGVDVVDVTIDRTDPSTPDVTLFEAGPYAHASGGEIFVNTAQTGSYTVSVTAADATSGLEKIRFPGPVDDSAPPYSAVYDLDELSGAQSVTAFDNAGNTASETFTVTADTAAPSGGSLSYPDGYDGDGRVTVTVDAGTDALSGIDVSSAILERRSAPLTAGVCDAFAGPWGPAASPDTVAENTCAQYRHRVSDRVGNEAVYTSGNVMKVDLSAPETTIDAAPSDPSSDTAPSFEFSASEPGSTFECALDGGGFSSCTSPQPVGPLADGSHTFRVRATDGAGNADPTPSSHTWTVDTAPPDTSFTVVPADPSNDPAPAFELGASEGGSTFECRLDDGAFSPCTSPHPVGPLADGSHTLAVRATDPAGNADATPESYTWIVDATAPEITLTQPVDFVNAADADPFTLRAASPDGDVARVEFFRCDDASVGCGNGSWVSLGTDTTPPYEASWSVDADGNRALRAVATDLGSNTGEDVIDVTIDRVRPVTAVGSAPADPSASAGATFVFSANEGDATFECALDGSGFAPCAAPKSYAGLADGVHTFGVRATDVAGNVEAPAQEVTWTVDTAAPQTVIDVAPTDPSASAAPTFEFSASEPGSTFECELDGNVFAPCTSPKAYAALADGPHVFRVRAEDQAGNVDPTAASHSWTIDATPPGGGLADPGANLRGTVALAASTTDRGVGVREVEFQVSPAGADVWTPIAADAADPYTVDWDTSTLGDGLYDLRVVVTDKAGNTTPSGEIDDRRVDNTAPSATMDDPGAHLRATVELSADAADAGSGVVSVTFERSPARAGAWKGVPASWDTTGVADGLYDLRVVVVDAAGNSTVSAPVADRRVDNTLPGVTASIPADGSTVSVAGSLQLVASEDLAGVAHATMDGAPAGGAVVSGTTVTWLGPFAEGPHVLTGELEDLAGNRRPIRLHFTVWSLAAGDHPYVEKNSPAGVAASVRSANDTATVTMPAGGWTGAPAGDWLVLRVDPAPVAAVPAGFAAAGDMLDVTAYWALSGTSVHDFGVPVVIDVDNTVAHVVPATLDGGSWRPLAPVPRGQALPGTWADGFYRDGSDVVVLTRHLSYFTLLEDLRAPTVPKGFRGIVKGGKLSLAWKESSDAGGIAGYRIYAGGALVRTVGAGVHSVSLGTFEATDERFFQVAAEDVAGNVGAKSLRLKVVPDVVALQLASARKALVERGFEVGRIRHRRSATVPRGAVVSTSASGVRAAGSSIGLVVSTGPGTAERRAADPTPPSPGTSGTTTPPPTSPAPTTPPPTYSAPPFGSAPVFPAPPPAGSTPAPAAVAAPASRGASAARRPDLRPQPLAEQVRGDGRKPLGFGLLVLAFGAALLAGLRLLRRARPARPRATGPEPLLLWDARLLRSATSAARRLAGRG